MKFLEKTVLSVCSFMLLAQIYLSVKDYKKYDCIQDRDEENLSYVDMPMVVVCAKKSFNEVFGNPFFYGFDSSLTRFRGWGRENKTPLQYLRSKATVRDVNDLVEEYFIKKTPWVWQPLEHQLQIKPMRMLFLNGQCYSLEFPKNFWHSNIDDFSLMHLQLKQDIEVEIYLHDVNIYNGYFNLGQKIDLDNKKGYMRYLEVSLKQIEHNPKDPKVSCQEYDANYSYLTCVTERAADVFLPLIGCVPPCKVAKSLNISDLVCVQTV